MWGIVGLACRGAQRTAEVEILAGRLAHRGPDATGSRSFGDCALGHTP